MRTFLTKPVAPTGSGLMTKIMDFAPAGTTILRAAAIPQTFTHLRVVFIMQSDRAGISNTGARFQINGASSGYDFNIYGYHFASTGSGVTQSYVGNQWSGYLGQCPAAMRGNDTSVATGTMDIPFYRAAVFHHMLVEASMSDGTVFTERLSIGNQFYGSSGPVTQIDLMDDASGALTPRAQASLYGIA